MVGGVDPGAVCKLLDKTFGSLPSNAEAMPVADVIAAKPPQRVFIQLDVPQTVVTFGGPAVRRSEPGFMPACIVNHILGGGGLTSRLFREVREKRGLAYSVREQLVWLDHSAMFLGTSGTAPIGPVKRLKKSRSRSDRSPRKDRLSRSSMTQSPT